MDFPPFVAQKRDLAGQHLNTVYFRPAESIALSQFCRSMWTIQDECRFTACSYHVDMCRPMIGRIDDHTKAMETENSRHVMASTNLSAQIFMAIWFGSRRARVTTQWRGLRTRLPTRSAVPSQYHASAGGPDDRAAVRAAYTSATGRRFCARRGPWQYRRKSHLGRHV